MSKSSTPPLRLDPRVTMVLGMLGGIGAVVGAIQFAAYPVLVFIESIPAWAPFVMVLAAPAFIILDYLECWLGGSEK